MPDQKELFDKVEARARTTNGYTYSVNKEEFMRGVRLGMYIVQEELEHIFSEKVEPTSEERDEVKKDMKILESIFTKYIK